VPWDVPDYTKLKMKLNERKNRALERKMVNPLQENGQ
jgi:hypothetical protein